MSENDDELDKLVQAEKIGSTVPTYLPTTKVGKYKWQKGTNYSVKKRIRPVACL